MSLTRLRSSLFSRLHREVLQPRGFVKSARFSTKHAGAIHFCVEREDARYDDGSLHATLRLNISVFHESVHSLIIGWPTFPGVDRSAIAVYRSGLRWMLEPPTLTEGILPDTDIDDVFAEYSQALNQTVLPLFQRCATPDGMLAVVREQRSPRGPDWRRSRVEAALLHISGRTDEARALLEEVLRSLEERLQPPVRELLARFA
jgi:hypothetical protein